MRIETMKLVRFVIVVATLAAFQGGATAQESHENEPAGAQEGKAVRPLGVADLIPAFTALSGRLSVLERNLSSGLDLSFFETDIERIDKQLEGFSPRLKELKETTKYGYDDLAAFKLAILTQGKSLDKIWAPLTERITQVGLWKSEWESEKQRWTDLQASLSKEPPSTTVQPALARAKETLDKAERLLSRHLDPLLAKEQKAAEIRANIDALVAQVDESLRAIRSDFRRKSAPPMFSSEYRGQFNRELWLELRKGLGVASWSEWQTFQKNTLVISLQVLLWLAFFAVILRNRASLASEDRLRFVAERPFAAGVFSGFVFLAPFYRPALGMWRVLFLAAISIAVARLSACCIASTWRRRAVYGLALLFVLNEFLQALGLPRPLFRLFVLLVALMGLLLCGWRALSAGRQGGHGLFRAVLWLGVAGSAIVLAAETSGYMTLAGHVLEAGLKSSMIVLAAWMLKACIRGTLEWIFRRSALTRVHLVQKNAAVIIHVSARLFNLILSALVIMLILVAWGFYDSNVEAIRATLSIGFTIGSWHLTVGYVFVAALLIYGAFLTSRAVQTVLLEEVFPWQGVERGVQISMGRLVHYGIMLVGFFLALAVLGVNFTNITIIGGALGVGIGFGLQAIVNNFVSGLILLFERPIRVGDYIEIGGLWAEVKRIGLRATVVETFDRADVVVPNSDLISNQVTNWTRTNRVIRLKIPVGVAYGSDVPLVMKILLEAASDNPSVLSSPKPQILFMGFGDSSLNFEIRAHLSDVDNIFIVRSEILQEVDQQFRKAGVEIPFPQRDLHLRSVDDEAGAKLRGSTSRGPRVPSVKKQDESA